MRRAAPDPHERAVRIYSATAARASRAVLAGYSTSFGLGTRLLGAQGRADIEAVYALVRIADEIVDTHRGPDAPDLLDELEAQTARALATGYSSNLVVHAFTETARRTGIGHGELDPFFASMRTDLTVRVHDRASYEAYGHGSAEIVGLMCLAVFLNADREPGAPVRRGDARLTAGAQALGAAFQKINFLRDLGADSTGLGRSYFPGVQAGVADARPARRDPGRDPCRPAGCARCPGGPGAPLPRRSGSTSGCSTSSPRHRCATCRRCASG
jgi:phytoene synthase